jgi:hypothetical protein
MRALLLIAGILVLGLIAGCGGSSDSGSSTGASNAATGAEGKAGEEAGGRGEKSGSNSGGVELNEARKGESTAPREAFVRGANGLCGQIGTKLSGEASKMIAKGSTSGSEAAAISAAVDQVVVPKLEEEQKRLSSLSVPVVEQAQMKEVLAGYEEAISEAKANPSKFGNAADPYGAIEKPANALGLTSCPL